MSLESTRITLSACSPTAPIASFAARALGVVLIATTLAGFGATDAAAGLRCHKIKDDLAKAAYSADADPLDPALELAPGCEIRVPAKLLCVGSLLNDLTPATPNPIVDDGHPQKFLCYKTKCADETSTFATSDAFGTHHLSVGKTSLVCNPVSAVCGDDILDDPEQCDDGNLTGGDGCTATCLIETTCGDGILGGTEECDDGNVLDADGCSASCEIQPLCGNGFLEPGEDCDDGNRAPGDGCNPDCRLEQP